MNAPLSASLLAPASLSSVAVCYSPLIDRKRKAIGTRLTTVSLRPGETMSLGQLLQELNAIWPETKAPILVAPLDAIFDDSLLDWQPPANAVLEVPGVALARPEVQDVVQRARRAGYRMALRGRMEVPLPPALASCFEYSLIHISEDRRLTPEGQIIPPPSAVQRQLPYIITGVQSVADVDSAFARGAVASVGWPQEDASLTGPRPLQAGQAVVLQLLRLVRDDADISEVEAALRQDPALAFKLLRLVNSAAFGLPVQITSFQHAVMMLGYKRMTRWLSLLLTTSSKDANIAPLVLASIHRGLFMEYVAGEDMPADVRDELFITGAFSLLDRITGASFEQLFNLIAVSEQVTEAIVRRGGAYGSYLGLIESIEGGNPIGIRRSADALALPVAHCNEALLRALAAAQALEQEL